MAFTKSSGRYGSPRLLHVVRNRGHRVTAYIEGFYNPVRLHSTLGYHAPAAFEAARVS